MFVVVEHDDQISIQVARRIEALIGQTSAQPAVADHRHHFTLPARKSIGFHHAERRGSRRAGMAGAKGVVFALVAREKAAQAAQLTNRTEPITPAADELMSVGLMSGVPNDP